MKKSTTIVLGVVGYLIVGYFATGLLTTFAYYDCTWVNKCPSSYLPFMLSVVLGAIIFSGVMIVSKPRYKLYLVILSLIVPIVLNFLLLVYLPANSRGY